MTALEPEDFRNMQEMDQSLSENLDELSELFAELMEIAEGDGAIDDEMLAAVARIACGTCVVMIGLRDYHEEQLCNGIGDSGDE
ncbi:MAG TPA: hypothetical protein VMW88_04185 [Thermoplasmata archaeon]|nr:hypothetical protein [Thermoplasmata archaeon]